jgi:hypothetical protein
VIFLVGIDVFVPFKGQQMYLNIYGGPNTNSTFKREKTIVIVRTLDIFIDHCAFSEKLLQLVAASPNMFSSFQWTASEHRHISA